MQWFRRSLIAGFFVTVPLIVSVVALVWMFQWIDGLMGPHLVRWLGQEVPGLGLLATIAGMLIVGAFATNNVVFNVGVMLAFGILGFFMEENEIPLAPCILGIVLGGLVENHFITTMIRNDGELIAFFQRPIAAFLGVLTLMIWIIPILGWARRRLRSDQDRGVT